MKWAIAESLGLCFIEIDQDNTYVFDFNGKDIYVHYWLADSHAEAYEHAAEQVLNVLSKIITERL